MKGPARWIRIGALAVVVSSCATGSGDAPSELEEVSGGGYVMGTVLEMTLLGGDKAALDAARTEAFSEIERLERELSRWVPESDISRLNNAAGKTIEVEPEVAELLRRCLEFSSTTYGAFDVTVGPLLALWRQAEERGRLPSEAAVSAALARLGAGKLRVGGDGRVRLARGSSLDLGAVAKGYALDRARAGLPNSVQAALLNFGQSSTWAVGTPKGAPGWRLLIQSPDGGYAGVLTLRDQALSASGSLGQWREIEGRQYGHVVDPRNGQPLTQRRQALVVARDAALAEMLSTAVLVLGEEEGIEIAQSLSEVEALLLDADGRSWRTLGWDRVTRFEAMAPAAP